ncbi:MAG: hypothetical protein A2Z08_07155 [Deltaproteobacteria bacterium RBG_16_54_11]|jgi:hypothetical protein|nr:MAG: hypothetical protein A2Z08_07155 [Deltaproteobacteria bacterium RBG_16_54_11]
MANSSWRGEDDDSGEMRKIKEKAYHEWFLASLQKFRLFFVGLVFAILAFSVQFGIKSSDVGAFSVQFLSWLVLLITGVLALRDAGGFVAEYSKDTFKGLNPKMRKVMWFLFVIAIFMLMLVRL